MATATVTANSSARIEILLRSRRHEPSLPMNNSRRHTLPSERNFGTQNAISSSISPRPPLDADTRGSGVGSGPDDPNPQPVSWGRRPPPLLLLPRTILLPPPPGRSSRALCELKFCKITSVVYFSAPSLSCHFRVCS